MLQDEIDAARREIRTDGYPMSIGEWISLYEKAELDIHPEFQRFFRWTPKQKSRLIESILLGIPIPPIFVAQRSDGVWDVVDGLQRLSTILQFVGILREGGGGLVEPLVLEPTKYLPSLEGYRWEDHENPDKSLSSAQKLIIKRSKIDASIILRESDDRAKYELFQRLNTGGSPLSPQEVRNSILVMLDPDLFRWMNSLTQNPDFQECTALSDRALEEQYHMELVLRFIVFRTMPEADLTGIRDMGDFLTDWAVKIAEEGIDRLAEERAFSVTFALLRQQLESDAFRRYDWERGKFLGGFSVSAFEAVALGVGYNCDTLQQRQDGRIAEKAKEIWRNDIFIANSGSGVRASTRVPRILPYARNLFAE